MSDQKTIDIQKAFDDLKGKMDASASEIKKQKDEIQKLQIMMENLKTDCNFVRHNKRLILSAPEIVIGNVDCQGNLLGSDQAGVVTIRSGIIQQHATGTDGGVIENKAAKIMNIAVDPGIDGKEEVLQKDSVIINQARTVSIESENDEECFVGLADYSKPGVVIKTDTILDIQAQLSNELKTKAIDELKSKLMSSKTKLTTKVATMQANLKAKMVALDLAYADQGLLSWGLPVLGLRTFPEKMWETQDNILKAEYDVMGLIPDYYEAISALVEVSRKLNALDKKVAAKVKEQKSDYKTKSTGAAINLQAENINVLSVDGDGNVRDNETAGLRVSAPHVRVETVDAKGALIKDSTMDINTKTFTLSTANAKYSDAEKRDSGDLTAEGDVRIVSKTLSVEGVDYKLNNKKPEEDKLTAGSVITLRAENVAVNATDKEGKATGSVKLTGKQMILRSQDIDAKAGSGKDLAAGGTLALMAEKLYVGSNTKKTKLVQVAGEKVGVIGKDTAEVQQDGKAVVTLSGGNMTAGGSKVELKGNTTIEGNADIKGETKAPKVTSDEVQAKSAFKSPNINDTMGAGVPGAAGSPSAKMTEEDAAEK